MLSEVLVEGVTRDMAARTSLKFAAWDRIVERNAQNHNDPEVEEQYYRLLNDPTIYAYAFFKDSNLQPFKLYPYQDMIINDPWDRIIFAAANQIGKSICLCIKAIHFALSNPSTTTLMTSKTLPQAKDLLRMIRTILKSAPEGMKYEVGDTDTKTEIYFKHYDPVYNEETKQRELKELPDARIICVPATEGALGYPVHLALVDELGFYDDGEYFYEQILQPRTYFTKGQIIIFSNPNGQQGILWKLWNNSHFHKYRFTYLDCPANSQQDFEKLCAGLSQERIDSTLLAVFTSPEGAFFSLEERQAMQENRANEFPFYVTHPVSIFYDFAKSQDRTVRITGVPYGDDPNSQSVYVYEMKEYPGGTPYDQIVDELNNLISLHGRQHILNVGWDNTGVGAGIEDFIKRVESLGLIAVPVEFTAENKSRIYIMLKFQAEKNVRGKQGIKIPFVQACDEQLRALRFKKTERYLKVHHDNERDRDDFPDALAGLCSLIIQPENPPVHADIINGDWSMQCEQCQCDLEIRDETCPNCGVEINDFSGVI